MASLAALLQTLGGVAQSGAKAKQELSDEDIQKKQIYSQLESAALQREHLRKIIQQMSANPQQKAVSDIEGAIGRKLTDVEKQRFFSVAPKEIAGKVVTKLEQDKNSKTGWSYVSYDPMSGQEYSRQLDAPPQRGLIESETSTTDPLTGLTTVSRRKPIIGAPGGSSGKGKSAATPAAATASPAGPLATLTAAPSGAAARPQLAGKRRGAGPLARKPIAAAKPSTAGALSLDAEGHIPQHPGVPHAVVETANELLDGKDMDKIKYAKLIPVASELARKYGWEQGKFTPREQVMLRETSTFIQRAMSDDSMKALDEGGMSRLRLQQIAQNPDKEGFLPRIMTLGAASGMTDSQKKFLQTYNQLVGTISGMAQLVRSGRATEATIERLKAELPNPTNTKDSKDARERLQRLMDEINVAMKKGTFTDSGNTSEADPAQLLINRILKGNEAKGGGASASPR